jgi:formylglycine-generating enzyme required for sulfatase activity
MKVLLTLLIFSCLLLTAIAGTPRPDPTPTPDRWLDTGRILVREKDEVLMVYVPGGTFQMGSSGGLERERPVHRVTLDSFWIDQTEVTNSQYARCVADGACGPPSVSVSYTRDSYYGDSQYSNYPVIYVSWYDATAYCEWVGGRLPSEAEWEYAASGPDSLTYPWGNEAPHDSVLTYLGNEGDTTKVGFYTDGASWVGALDMAGNVWEWVNDWYDRGYYASSPAHNPPGPEAGEHKVLRGGSWVSLQSGTLAEARATSRLVYDPGYRYHDFGFRCVVASGG